RTVVLFTVLPVVFAVLLYKVLTVVEKLDFGPTLIMVLAFGTGVLMIALILMVVIISLIEYLRTFE
ncbi:MAG: hypothetical protein GY703_13240, partial [Gammaproteobacteria bacterium]|nr:hypothetical protein [Gammaproteobacteria bacterium]